MCRTPGLKARRSGEFPTRPSWTQVLSVRLERSDASRRVIADQGLAPRGGQPLCEPERAGDEDARMDARAHGYHAVEIAERRIVLDVDLEAEVRGVHEEGAIVRERVSGELRRNVERCGHSLARLLVPGVIRRRGRV